MKSWAILTIIFALMTTSTTRTDSIYSFTLKNIDGKTVPLEQFEGKVLLIVNTASECGFTPQYEGLQALYETYKDQGLVILGFPANNFGGQAPGTDEEIKKFCTTTFQVTFPMFSKISVKGDNIEPLFQYLTTQKNPDFTGDIKWNFEKFLINRQGQLVRRFRSPVEPQNKKIIGAIESLLKS